jgi:hypothetical protein
MSSESSSEPPYTLGREDIGIKGIPVRLLPLHAWDHMLSAGPLRLSHRRLGIFLHVILAQLFFSLVPGMQGRKQTQLKVEERSMVPKGVSPHVSPSPVSSLVTSRGSVGGGPQSGLHPEQHYRCWRLEMKVQMGE